MSPEHDILAIFDEELKEFTTEYDVEETYNDSSNAMSGGGGGGGGGGGR